MSRAPAPAWLLALAARLHEIRPETLSRFLPPETGGRPSAVLILFGPGGDSRDGGDSGQGADSADGDVDLLLTQRASGMRAHPGQVAFPGGSVDVTDAGAAAAALREAVEETGLDPAGVEILGALPDLYLPYSDFVVTPVLAWWAEPSPVDIVDPVEVARVVRVPLVELLEPVNRFAVRHPSGNAGPGFAAQDLFIWGFTAGLLSRLLDQAGLTRAWDESLVRDVPEILL